MTSGKEKVMQIQQQAKKGHGSDTATDTGKGMMNHSIRLSRVNHPRGTLVAMVLLATVFLLFGVFAHALHPELAAQAPAATSDVMLFLANLR